MQTIFKWPTLPLAQLSRSFSRWQFEQIVIDSHLTVRSPFQLMAQSQSQSQSPSTCSTLCAPTERSIDRLSTTSNTYFKSYLSWQWQWQPVAATSLPRWTVKIDALAIYSRCLRALNDRRLPASYSHVYGT